MSNKTSEYLDSGKMHAIRIPHFEPHRPTESGSISARSISESFIHRDPTLEGIRRHAKSLARSRSHSNIKHTSKVKAASIKYKSDLAAWMHAHGHPPELPKIPVSVTTLLGQLYRPDSKGYTPADACVTIVDKMKMEDMIKRQTSRKPLPQDFIPPPVGTVAMLNQMKRAMLLADIMAGGNRRQHWAEISYEEHLIKRELRSMQTDLEDQASTLETAFQSDSLFMEPVSPPSPLEPSVEPLNGFRGFGFNEPEAVPMYPVLTELTRRATHLKQAEAGCPRSAQGRSNNLFPVIKSVTLLPQSPYASQQPCASQPINLDVSIGPAIEVGHLSSHVVTAATRTNDGLQLDIKANLGEVVHQASNCPVRDTATAETTAVGPSERAAIAMGNLQIPDVFEIQKQLWAAVLPHRVFQHDIMEEEPTLDINHQGIDDSHVNVESELISDVHLTYPDDQGCLNCREDRFSDSDAIVNLVEGSASLLDKADVNYNLPDGIAHNGINTMGMLRSMAQSSVQNLKNKKFVSSIRCDAEALITEQMSQTTGRVWRTVPKRMKPMREESFGHPAAKTALPKMISLPRPGQALNPSQGQSLLMPPVGLSTLTLGLPSNEDKEVRERRTVSLPALKQSRQKPNKH